MSIKWKIVDREVVGEKDGYNMAIIRKAAYGYTYWEIKKDGKFIDYCYRYSPCTSEAAAKVMIEKVLDKILNQQKP